MFLPIDIDVITMLYSAVSLVGTGRFDLQPDFWRQSGSLPVPPASVTVSQT